MRDTILTLICVLAFLVALPISILWLRDKIFRSSRKRSSEEAQARLQAHRERLLNPQQTQVEAKLGALLPERLIALYGDKELLLNGEFEICQPGKDPKKSNIWIEDFLPLDWESQQYTCDLELVAHTKGFCFARDGCGNFYWVLVGATRQPDSPVFFACHDPWGNKKIGDSLEEFLSWPLRYKKKA